MNIAPKNTDFQVSQPPTDAVTALAFSKHQDFLAASSFDGQTRIYQVQPNGSSIPKSSIQHEGMKAAMSCCWSSDGSKVFSVGGDGQGKMIDLATGAVQQVIWQRFTYAEYLGSRALLEHEIQVRLIRPFS